MLPYFTENFGNASSKQHSFGWAADRGVEAARQQVASLIGASQKEIIFTNGGTESNNFALRGILEAYGIDKHIITTAVEHKAILEECEYLKSRGTQVTILPVDRLGLVSEKQILEAIRPNTILISLLLGNNEIGTLLPLKNIVRAIRAKSEAFIHTDAVQAVGRMPIDVYDLDVDLLSISAHKIYGPKGVGALFIRSRTPRIKLSALFHGGGQERGLRSGTLNVPGIVGLGKACELLSQEMPIEVARIKKLQKLMIERIIANPNLKINGPWQNDDTQRLCTNVSVTVDGIRSQSLIQTLKEVAFSTGSACSSQSVTPSYVLKAIGLSDEEAASTIRFGLGRFTTEIEVSLALDLLFQAIDAKLRNSNSHNGFESLRKDI
jgi:cysteine desulfurase